MSLLILILFALLIPLLLLVLFYRLVSVSFVRLGIPPRLVAALFIGILVGGLVNIPVWGVADATRGALFTTGHFFFLQPPSVATTIIAVAHRIRTIENADRIIVMGHGRIVEEGSKEQLIEKQGAFKELILSGNITL